MVGINEIIKGIKAGTITGKTDPVIKNIEFDSRKVSPGTLFVAVKGTKNDGHDFIEGAIE